MRIKRAVLGLREWILAVKVLPFKLSALIYSECIFPGDTAQDTLVCWKEITIPSTSHHWYIAPRQTHQQELCGAVELKIDNVSETGPAITPTVYRQIDYRSQVE
jgi:hypothetical protein